MIMNDLFWIVPVCSLIALGFAWFFFRGLMKESEGTDRMITIAEHVRKGAMAYLRQQYKVVAIFFLVITVVFAVLAYVFHVQNDWVPFAFLTGGFFSGLAGFFGMKTATYASARTANAAMKSLNQGLKIAFRSGAVMGLVVVGLGLLDISAWFIILNYFVPDSIHGGEKMMIITTTMLTFGMGASAQALFARVGGGIFTKAADVGGDPRRQSRGGHTRGRSSQPRHHRRQRRRQRRRRRRYGRRLIRILLRIDSRHRRPRRGRFLVFHQRRRRTVQGRPRPDACRFRRHHSLADRHIYGAHKRESIPTRSS